MKSVIIQDLVTTFDIWSRRDGNSSSSSLLVIVSDVVDLLEGGKLTKQRRHNEYVDDDLLFQSQSYCMEKRSTTQVHLCFVKLIKYPV
jgi:hypothetical protein